MNLLLTFGIFASAGGGTLPVPVNVTPPSLPSTALQVGDVITPTPGTWSNSPSILTYEWFRDGVSQGTSATYTVTVDDVGAVLDFTETATNASGNSAPEPSSNQTDPVTGWDRTAFISSTGDDGTAQMNDPALPWATVDTAITALLALTPGDPITLRVLDDVGSGVNDVPLLAASYPDGLTIMGHGGIRTVDSALSFAISSPMELTLDAIALTALNFNPATCDDVGTVFGLNGATISQITGQGAGGETFDGASGSDDTGATGLPGNDGDDLTPPTSGGVGVSANASGSNSVFNSTSGANGKSGIVSGNLTIGTITATGGGGGAGGSGGNGATATGGTGGNGGNALGIEDVDGGAGGPGGDATSNGGSGSTGGNGGDGGTWTRANGAIVSSFDGSQGGGGAAGGAGSAGIAIPGSGGAGGTPSGAGSPGATGSDGTATANDGSPGGSSGVSGNAGSLI